MKEPRLEGNEVFYQLMGETVLLVTQSKQLNILGQTFKPIFTGRLVAVNNGFITLEPAIIKMQNAPFFKFPTPLNFPIENIAVITPFDLDRKIPLV